MSTLTEPPTVAKLVVAISVYDKGQLPDGRTVLEFQHDVDMLTFSDDRMMQPAFIRQALMAVAASIPPEASGVVTNPAELFPAEVLV